jgi:hypothetical protein
MRSSRYLSLLLALTLLFTQLGSLTHGISHTLDEQKQNSGQSLPHDKLCDLCVAYAQIGGAISSNSVGFIGSAGIEAFHVDHFSTAFSSRFVAFSARAPPYSA